MSGSILLTGVTGQVGGALLHTLAPLGEIVAPRREQMDLANPSSIRETIRAVRPRWIVNPAAYTAVDKAESEPSLTYAINHVAVETIGQQAKAINAGVIHFSTDYVFDGQGTMPYRETDPTGPRSVYGASKLAGEQALAATGAAHIILRTSWVYGSTGKNFLLTILKLARERDTLRIVADQHGAPTWSRDLAQLTTAIIQQCEARGTQEEKPLVESLGTISGVYHVTGGGETTWHGFAEEALRQAGERQPSVALAALHAIPSIEYPTPAQRPYNSRLDNQKLARTFGQRLPEWRQSLASVMDLLTKPPNMTEPQWR